MDAASSEPPRVRAYAAQDRAAVVAMLTGRDPWQRLGYTADDWQPLLTPPWKLVRRWATPC